MSTENAAGQLSVLVVDDDPMVNRLVTKFATQQGYRVDSAFDGDHALRIFEAGKYDVVISDIRMPRMDGWQLAAALQKTAPGIPVLLITAYTNPGGGAWNQAFLKQHGILALLGKPIDFLHLGGLLGDIKRKKLAG